MEIRFECGCYDRTLVIEIPARDYFLKEEFLECLDQYYTEWIFMDGPYEEGIIQYMCLEEYMMERLSENYDMWIKWYVEED